MGSSEQAEAIELGHGLRVTRPSHRCMIVEWDDLEPREFLLRADAHHDNIQSDRVLELRHLQQAIDNGRGILDFGDLFCLMEGKWDKRKSPKHSRVEHHAKNYYDAVIKSALRHYEPYAKNWLMMAPGNHETAFTKRHETDPTETLVERLNERTGSSIERMPYSGWVMFRARHPKHPNQLTHTFRLWYTHGYGGGGPVTKGVIQANRRTTYAGTADMLVSGHIHERWEVTYVHDRCSSQGATYFEEQKHICLPTYKREYAEGEGFHTERGGPPKPLGATWLRLDPVEANSCGVRRNTLLPITWDAK